MSDIRNYYKVTGILSGGAWLVGMVTDSRSFLSYPRHEYFRRILCNILGSEMAGGELPQDIGLVGECARRVSYLNAKNYFKF